MKKNIKLPSLLHSIRPITFILSFALIGAAPSAFSKTDNEYYENALKSYQNQKTADAIIYLKNALGINEGHLPSRVLMAKALIANGDGLGAELHIDFAKAQGVDLNQIITLYGEAYLLQHKYKQLLETLQPGTRNRHIEGQIHFLRGQAFLKLQRHSDADISYIQSLNLVPNNEQAWLGRAQIAIHNRNLKLAERHLDKALDRFAPSTNSLNMKATLLRINGDPTQAIEVINRAIRQDPKHPQARLTRALLLMEQNKLIEAEPDLDAILEEVPDEPKAQFLKIALESSLGRKVDSQSRVRDMTTLLNAIPEQDKINTPFYYYLTGITSFKLGNYRDATRALSSFIKARPNSAHAMEVLATIYIQTGEFFQAKNILRKANTAYPNKPNILNLLGLLNQRLNNYDEAYYFFNEVVRLAPDSPVGVANLAKTKLQEQKYDEGIDLIKKAEKIGLPELETNLMLLDAYTESSKYDLALEISSNLTSRFPTNPHYWRWHGVIQGLQQTLEEARTSFHKALKIDPNYTPAIIHLSRMEEVNDNTEAAIELIQQSLKKQKGDLLLLQELGNIYANKNDFETSLTWYQKAYTQHPNDNLSLNKLVDTLIALKKHKKAIEILKDFVNRNGNDPAAHRLIGNLYEELHENEEAITAYRLATKYAKNKGEELLNLAQMQEKVGRITDAKSSYNRAIVWDPEYLPAYLGLVRIAINTEDQTYAQNLISQIEELTPSSGLSGTLYGDMYFNLSQYELAEHHYKKSLEIRPTDENTFKLYKLYKRQNRHAESQQLIEAWLKKSPDNLLAQIFLADSIKNQGQLRIASKHYDSLIEKYGNMPVLLNNSANIAFELGDANKALQYAEKANEIAPNNVVLMDTLAWIYSRQNKHDEALALFRQALLQEFDQPTVKYHLAVTLDKLDRRTEAKRLLVEAMDSDKHFPEKETVESLLKQWMSES
ncbi:MAG: PEP-CTERM system TPR-repeat protein PrsT [Motiliproteus sp.]|nr:PEP-CTERM system TPR-repeat protein PrsT [Motiliproteus sp.]MCW9051888.1 PEP-CTERM system TPR-repeat protein PrsT [Motiliproteus sp.]